MQDLLKILVGLISLSSHYLLAASRQFRRVAYGYNPLDFDNPYTSQAAVSTFSGSGKAKNCTGTIITSTAVLTAARCLDNNPDKVKVKYGSYIFLECLSANGKKWIQHPEWKSSKVDIALIIVDAPMNLTYPTGPVGPLAWWTSDSEWAKDASNVTICGWGYDEKQAS